MWRLMVLPFWSKRETGDMRTVDPMVRFVGGRVQGEVDNGDPARRPLTKSVVASVVELLAIALASKMCRSLSNCRYTGAQPSGAKWRLILHPELMLGLAFALLFYELFLVWSIDIACSGSEDRRRRENCKLTLRSCMQPRSRTWVSEKKEVVEQESGSTKSVSELFSCDGMSLIRACAKPFRGSPSDRCLSAHTVSCLL